MLTTLIQSSPLLISAIALSVFLILFGSYRLFFYRPKKSMYFSSYPEQGASTSMWYVVVSTILIIVALLILHFRQNGASDESVLQPALLSETSKTDLHSTNATVSIYNVVSAEQLQDLNECERRYIKSYLDQNVSEPLRENVFQQFKSQCSGNPSISDLMQARLDQLAALVGNASKKMAATGQQVLMPPPPEFLSPAISHEEPKRLDSSKGSKNVVAKAASVAASAASSVLSPANTGLKIVSKKELVEKPKDMDQNDKEIKHPPAELKIEPVELSLEKEGT